MTPSLALGLMLVLPSADVASVEALSQLSAERFQRREAGQRHLASQMPRVRLLVQFGAQSGCLEARRRCCRILSEYRPSLLERLLWWAEVIPGRVPHFDMVAPRMYPDMESDEPHVVDMLGHATRQELFFWYYAKAGSRSTFGPDTVYSRYREATLWYVLDCERAGHGAEQVRAFLDSLIPVECDWYSSASIVRP